MSNPLTDRDRAKCDARVVYVAYCTVHGVIGDGVNLHKCDAEEEAADHNTPDPCTCFRDGEFWPDGCALHRQVAAS